MAEPSPIEAEEARRRLREIREALMVLHKTLVESERAEYEKTVGAIPSPSHFLQLLTNDPWFVWLHPLSHWIVSLDEALDGKEPLTVSRTDALIGETYRLLVASETGHGFSQQYFAALQRDPDVVLAHAAVVKWRMGRKSAG